MERCVGDRRETENIISIEDEIETSQREN